MSKVAILASGAMVLSLIFFVCGIIPDAIKRLESEIIQLTTKQ